MTIYKFLTEKHGTAVSEIVKFVELKQPTVSYHLNEMKKNGLLSSKKIGKEVFYTVNSVCPHYESACVAHGIKFLPVRN